jgi:hypothetical protein
MNELLEHDLREFFLAYDESYDAASAVERLRAHTHHRARHGHRLWAAVAAGGTALTAGITTTILLLSTGTPIAYAGWSAVPTTPTIAELHSLVASCAAAGKPALTEARGNYTAAIYLTNDSVYQCITGTGNESGYSGRIPARPGPDELSSPVIAGDSAKGFPGSASALSPRLQQTRAQAMQRACGNSLSDANSTPTAACRQSERAWASGLDELPFETHLFGRAGDDISAVTFAFSNGATVQATVENGWYFAWWPWNATPTSAEVTTSTGTVTSPLPGPQCDEQSNSCVFVGAPQD